jgi:hypothetical protein
VNEAPPPPAIAEPATPTGFVVGLDLGQARDFTALVVNERATTKAGAVHHNLVHLHRFALGTLYPDVVDGVAKLLAQLPPRPEPPSLAVDATGVGRPVVDLLRDRHLAPVAVTITGGDTPSRPGLDEWRLPKRLLASILQVALQTGRVRIAAAMPLTPVLTAELESFRVKINVGTGNESFEAWRERDHDDLVLATAVAVWYAEETARGYDLMRMMGYDAGSQPSGGLTSYERIMGGG